MQNICPLRGAPNIVTFAALTTEDFVSDECWLVPGNPVWDAQQKAWWQTPQVPPIVEALKQAYEKGKTKSPQAVEFAQQFHTETVWKEYWMPILRKQFV